MIVPAEGATCAAGDGRLSEADRAALAARWISPEIQDSAGLYRVTSSEGAAIIGQEGREGREWKAGPDYSGIAIPYRWPGENHVRLVRIRRDHPDLEEKLGQVHQRRKYMGAPGCGNKLYVAPGLEARFLDDVGMPLVIVEGEFKTLALWRLAWHGLGDVAESPAFVPLGLQGVFSWRGKVGRVEAEGPGQFQDVKGPVADLGRIAWGGRKTIILLDVNVDSNEQVGEARRQLTRELESRGAEISWFKWPADVGEEINGIDDFLAQRGPEETIRQLGKARRITRKRKIVTITEALAGEEWRNGLVTAGNGGIKSIVANAITFLVHHPDLQGLLSYDEFAVRTMALAGTPWNPQSREWGETDDTGLAEWLQHHDCHVGKATCAEAVALVSRRHSFHPVREYLSKLAWDGRERIDTWLRDFVGVEDSKYSRAVGSRWLISAVARVMEPGCQADHCLILQGPQGRRKSTLLRVLAGEWFTDQVGDLANKDSAQQIHGVWIVEFAELEQLLGLRAETAVVKAFITRRVDRFRPPYDRRPADFPRQCVFAGTVNLEQFYRDDSGSRRFWAVECGSIDIAALERDRDQLWVEARVRYERRDPWHLDTAELVDVAAEEQDLRFEGDPWDAVVWDWVEGARLAFAQQGHPVDAFFVTIDELLGKALKKPDAAWTEQDKRRIGRIMRRHGLVYHQESERDAEDAVVREPNGRVRRRRVYRWPLDVSQGGESGPLST
jgi:predicted P-loop ATPase